MVNSDDHAEIVSYPYHNIPWSTAETMLRKSVNLTTLFHCQDVRNEIVSYPNHNIPRSTAKTMLRLSVILTIIFHGVNGKDHSEIVSYTNHNIPWCQW